MTSIFARAAEPGVQTEVELEGHDLQPEPARLLPAELRQRYRPRRVPVHAPLVVQHRVGMAGEDDEAQRKLSRIVSISSSS